MSLGVDFPAQSPPYYPTHTLKQKFVNVKGEHVAVREEVRDII